MADDITNRELAARLDDLRTAVRELVGRLEYEAYQRDIDHRLDGVGRDLGALAGQHARDIEAVHDRLDKAEAAAREHRMSWRTIIYTGLIPALVVLFGTVLEVWAMRSGGH